MGGGAEKGRQTLAQIPVARVPAATVQRAASAACPEGKGAVPVKRSMRGQPIGAILVAHGRLGEAVLAGALERHQRFGGKLSELLVAEGHVSELDVIRALSEQTGIPFVSDGRLERMEPPADALALLQADAAERLRVLPLALKGRELVCAMPEPGNLAVIDEVKFLAGVPSVRGVFATGTAIRKGLRRFYHGEVDGPDVPAGAAAQVTPWPSPNAWVPPTQLPPPAHPVAPPVLYPVAGAPVEIPEALLVPEPEIAEALLVPEPEIADALVLEEDPCREADGLRRRTIARLLAQRGRTGELPGLVRRLATRLGAPDAEAEQAVAIAEAAVLLAPPGPLAPDPAALAASLGDDEPCADLLACLAGGAEERPAAAAFAAAVLFTAAAGTEGEAAAALADLAADPRLGPEALAALREELGNGDDVSAA